MFLRQIILVYTKSASTSIGRRIFCKTKPHDKHLHRGCTSSYFVTNHQITHNDKKKNWWIHNLVLIAGECTSNWVPSNLIEILDAAKWHWKENSLAAPNAARILMELHFPVISSQCSYLELAGGGYLRQVEVKRVFFLFFFQNEQWTFDTKIMCLAIYVNANVKVYKFNRIRPLLKIYLNWSDNI